MKTSNIFFTAIASAAISTTAYAADISIADYTEATSAYQEAYINGNLNLNRGRSDASTGYDLNLNTNYDQVFSSQDQDNRVNLNLNGNISKGSETNSVSSDSYNASAEFTSDNYIHPEQDDLFWYGSAKASATDQNESTDIRGVLGVGYGRVVNVTPMARAIRIVEELNKNGAFNGTPAKSDYIAVAQIVEKESEYRSKYGARDYENYWVQDIVNQLKSNNLLNDKFSTADVLRLGYIVKDERISTRKNGWKVRAGVGYAYKIANGDDSNDPTLELGAEYHKPLSNQTQFSNEFTVNTLLGSQTSYTAQNQASLTHELSDRVDWENSLTTTYKKDGDAGTKATQNVLSSAFIYNINNALDYTVTASLVNDSGDVAQTGTDRALNMGIRYRLK